MILRSMLLNSDAATVSRSSFMCPTNDPKPVEVSSSADLGHSFTDMSPDRNSLGRAAAVDRAWSYSPFLREAGSALPEITEVFGREGTEAAIRLALAASGQDLEVELRRQRHGLALAVALGDLAAELSLEEVTRVLSDFADVAIDRALRQAISERIPDADPTGFAVIAMGK